MAELNAAALIREDTFTIHVRFVGPAQTTPGEFNFDPEVLNISNLFPREYIYICTIPVVEGEFVVVPARGVPTVVIVTKVDATVELNPNHERQIAWVIGKIDMTIFEENVSKNRQLNSLIQKAYVQNARSNFRQMILSGLSDESRTQITTMLKG